MAALESWTGFAFCWASNFELCYAQVSLLSDRRTAVLWEGLRGDWQVVARAPELSARAGRLQPALGRTYGLAEFPPCRLAGLGQLRKSFIKPRWEGVAQCPTLDEWPVPVCHSFMRRCTHL